MSLRLPLAVRLATAYGDRHVTRDLRSLSFRSAAVGGFASAQLSFDRPINRDDPAVAPFGKIYISDGRHGGTVWEGWQEDPGKGAGSDGQVREISALGPSARASDTKQAWIYIDQQFSRMTRTPGASTVVATTWDSDANDLPTIRMAFMGGQNVAANDLFRGIMYTGLYDTGQKVARCGGTRSAFPSSASWGQRVAAQPDRTSGGDLLESVNFSTTPAAFGPFIITTHFTAGRTVIEFQFVRGGTGINPSEAGLNAVWRDFYILGTRYKRDGTESTSASDYNQAAPNILQAHLVVEDLLGRLLPTYDGPGARIDTNTYNIDQLAYPDGATAAEILDDCMGFEPAYRWQAWESAPLVAGGLSRFEWSPWPSTVRYEASAVDGFTAPSSAAELFDRVFVRWVDIVGRSRQRIRTQTVQALADAGISRQDFLDLGDSAGSDANAIQTADGFLADHATVPGGGTLTVARPILDNDSGRMVAPWEIRPGHLIRVRDLAVRGDALVASGRDGVATFRVAATSFDSDSASAQLELDTYPRTVSQAIAKLAKAQAARRRR